MTGPAERSDIPVTVIGGYLGAGKTTLINRLLADGAGRRLAVLVNDFGAVNVDSGLIAAHDGRTMSLTNGCVCCSIADDLAGAVAEAAALEPPVDHIVIEASGVADPGRISAHAFGRPGLRLAGVVTLADVTTLEARAEDRFVGATVRRQLRAADLILLTKADLASADRARATRLWAETLAQGVTARQLDLDAGPSCVLDALRPDGAPPQALFGDAGPALETQAETAVWRGDGVFDRAALEAFLRSRGADLLRAKGWVRCAEDPQEPMLVQLVGDRLEITPAGGAAGLDLDLAKNVDVGPESGLLVFIFRREAFPASALLDGLQTCLARPEGDAG